VQVCFSCTAQSDHTLHCQTNHLAVDPWARDRQQLSGSSLMLPCSIFDVQRAVFDTAVCAAGASVVLPYVGVGASAVCMLFFLIDGLGLV